MTSPYSSAATTIFSQSGNPSIDPLLNSDFQKWGGSIGSGANLSFSFPWINGNLAYWQSNYGGQADNSEINATYHFGFNETQIQATTKALQSWSSVAKLSFTEVAETSSNVGDLRFAFSSDVDGIETWGWSYYPNDYLACAGDIWVAPNASNNDWSVGSFNFFSLAHEIGHALGLKHPGNYNAGGGGTPPPYLPVSLDFRDQTIMSYNGPISCLVWNNVTNTSSIVVPETPMVYDVQAIQYIYGANTSFNVINNSYKFDPNTPFFKTIWDAGGVDAIDISNYSLDCIINLNPGSYSKISYAPPGLDPAWYDGTNALGIAFGVTIENVIGGSGNDIFITNHAGNTINGGAGIDTVAFSGDLSSAVITYLPNTYSFKVTTTSGGSDTVYNCEYFQFSDKTVATSAYTAADRTAPTVKTFSPADESSSVAVDSNIVVTFSEAITRGAGNIVLKTVAGVTVATYDAATSSNLSISGSTLTINPIANLTAGTSYKVEFAAGTIKDLAGNSYAGTTGYNFTTLSANHLRITSSYANFFLLDENAELAGNSHRLDFINVDGIRFSLGGMTIDLQSTEAQYAGTHEGFVAALQNPLDVLIASGALPAGTTLTLDPGYTRVTGLPDGSMSGPIPAIVLTSGNGLEVTPLGFSDGEDLVGQFDVYGRFDSGSITTNLPTLYARTGNDLLQAQDDIETVSYINGISGTTGVTVSLALVTAQATGGSGSDTLIGINHLGGSNYADKLSGNSAANVIFAFGGNDTVDGGAGSDNMHGGQGNDIYYVRDAGDVVTELASEGTDLVCSYLSAHTLSANVENGRIISTGAASLTGNASNNVIFAGAGNNLINGGTGTDTVSYFYGVTGTAGVSVSLALATAQTTGGSGSDTLTAIENLSGSNNADKLTGNSSANTLYGYGGNDTIDGGLGSDIMHGGQGNDTYYVRDAGDVVTELASEGTDLVYSYLSAYTLGANVENGRIISTGAANLAGNGLSNTIFAGAGNNVVNGGYDASDFMNGGIDTLSYAYGLSSTSTVGVTVSLALSTAQATGGSGSDTITNFENLIGSGKNDKLTGSASDNSLNGGVGNDSLNGGSGNDILIGGAGKDVLTGGVGSDIFDFNAVSETGITSTTWDVITDFVRGQDRIDLSTLDANTATTSNDAFSGILIAATASFTKAGQLQLKSGVLYGNTDADATAEFAIALTGMTALSAADFVL